jgi:hypothetical protein
MREICGMGHALGGKYLTIALQVSLSLHVQEIDSCQ